MDRLVDIECVDVVVEGPGVDGRVGALMVDHARSILAVQGNIRRGLSWSSGKVHGNRCRFGVTACFKIHEIDIRVKAS